jgi:hypothetical protein
VICFQTSVCIERPIAEVFGFVSNPTLFPRWNSAVRTVDGIFGETGGLGATYSMQRELPSGRVDNDLEIFIHKHPTEFAVRTTSGPTPFSYQYRFIARGGDTVVHLDATVELPGVAAMLGPVAARGVRRGVDANFAALKLALEASITPRGCAL